MTPAPCRNSKPCQPLKNSAANPSTFIMASALTPARGGYSLS
jgi:hypothetical protein